MGKKIIKVNGKAYVVDEKDMEEVEADEEEEASDETTEEDADKSNDDAGEETTADSSGDEKEGTDAEEKPEEGFEKKIDEASEKIVEKLGIGKMQSKLSDLEKKFEEKSEAKVSALIDLEKLMKKSVDEMTTREKILGFFQGIMRNDHSVLKALSEGTAADGGYLFPDEFRAEVIRDIEETPHMRNEVRVITMKRDVMNIPTLISGPQISWTDELAAKSTTTARFSQATLTAYKMAAIQYISDELIADSDLIDVVDLVIRLFSEAIGREEDRVITAGSGTGQPTGYSSGGLGIQTVACSGNLDFDDIINLIYLLPKKYNANAKFFIHRNNIREMRKIQDSDGRYLWQEPLSAGQPATVHGFPVIEDNNLPESEIYFGDLRYAYWLGDRQMMTVKISQDTTQAFTKDQTAIRVVSRIAGTVVEARAIKCLNSIP